MSDEVAVVCGRGDLHAVVLGMIFGLVATVFLARGIFGGFLGVFLVIGLDFAGKADISNMKEKLQVGLGRGRTQRSTNFAAPSSAFSPAALVMLGSAMLSLLVAISIETIVWSGCSDASSLLAALLHLIPI